MTTPIELTEHPLMRAVRRIDTVGVAVTVLLAAIGLVAIASTTGAVNGATGYLVRQLAFLAVGTVLAAVLAVIDVRRWRPLAPGAFVVTVAVLVAVLGPLGATVNGTRGWIRIGGFSVQPAEFAKLTVIVGLAAALSRPKGKRFERMVDAAADPRRLVAALGLLGIIVLLVLAEGETGSVLVYCMVALAIFFVAGSPPRLLGLLVVSGALAFALAFSGGLLGDHVADRFTAFLDAEADPRGTGYHQLQSVTTIGSGGLVGQGLFEGPQTQFGFLPEKQTDFIFAAVGEETGFVGVAVVLALYAILLRRVFQVAKSSGDRFGRLVAVGVFAMLLVQVVQNIGMTIRLLPITGIPLPLLSYGGSSLLTTLMALGLVQSVHLHATGRAGAESAPVLVIGTEAAPADRLAGSASLSPPLA